MWRVHCKKHEPGFGHVGEILHPRKILKDQEVDNGFELSQEAFWIQKRFYFVFKCVYQRAISVPGVECDLRPPLLFIGPKNRNCLKLHNHYRVADFIANQCCKRLFGLSTHSLSTFIAIQVYLHFLISNSVERELVHDESLKGYL